MILHHIRRSFTNQLTLWVAGIVMLISVVVIGLLALFSQDVIRDESVETTLQSLENKALRIDNTLRQAEKRARLTNQPLTIDRARIERLIKENGYLTQLRKSLPNASLTVVEKNEPMTSPGQFLTGEGGYREADYNGEDSYIFYQPIREGAYSLMVTCPANDIYGRYSRMQWFLALRCVAGVLILLVILYVIVGRHLRPLHRLADSAQGIAQGNLDTPITDSLHDDETGRLQNSLAKMQQALKAYLAEMQQKQSVLSQQNTELKAAYAEVQAYESMKSNFVRDMTAQMAAPVADLCEQTDAICRDTGTMTKTEMVHRQMLIMQDTETITRLLDQLLNNTAL